MLKFFFITVLVMISLINCASERRITRQELRSEQSDLHEYYQKRRQESEVWLQKQRDQKLRSGIRKLFLCTPICCFSTSFYYCAFYNLCDAKRDCGAFLAGLPGICLGLGLACSACEDLSASNICQEKHCCQKCATVCLHEGWGVIKDGCKEFYDVLNQDAL